MMAVSRRHLIKAGLAAGMAFSVPQVLRAQTRPNAARTVRMVMQGDLRIFNPYYSTTDKTWDQALAIYDTLFGLDSMGMPQPQMVGKWSVSDDKKTYTFELRDGLDFHDGTPGAGSYAGSPGGARRGRGASPVNPPSGCAFHPRCPHAVERCRIEIPPLVPMADGRIVGCHVRAPAVDIPAQAAAAASYPSAL